MADTPEAPWVPGPGYASIIRQMREQDEQAERDRNTPATVPIPAVDTTDDTQPPLFQDNPNKEHSMASSSDCYSRSASPRICSPHSLLPKARPVFFCRPKPPMPPSPPTVRPSPSPPATWRLGPSRSKPSTRI